VLLLLWLLLSQGQKAHERDEEHTALTFIQDIRSVWRIRHRSDFVAPRPLNLTVPFCRSCAWLTFAPQRSSVLNAVALLGGR
jgi:hypothetical protein